MGIDIRQRGHDASSVVPPIHIKFLRVYEDFHNMAEIGSAPTKFMQVIAQAKQIIANTNRHDISVVLAALRRKATAQLLLNQPKRALGTAEQIIRQQFDWPYGHLVKADALLSVGNLAAAANAYQLAEQFMPAHDPTDDIGRSEVLEQCQALADGMAAVSCLTLTAAHDCEITAMASWPQELRAVRPAHTRPKRSAISAENLQDSLNSAVNSALEIISRDGHLSHVPLHLQSQQASDASPDSPMWGVLGNATAATLSETAASVKAPSVDAPSSASRHAPNTLDQLLADEMRRTRLLADSASARASPAERTMSRETQQEEAAGSLLNGLLDTRTSSVTDPGAGLRTTTSERSDLQLAGNNALHLSMHTSPSPSVPAVTFDSQAEEADEARAGGTSVATGTASPAGSSRQVPSDTHVTGPSQTSMAAAAAAAATAQQHSTLGSAAGEERNNSTLGSTTSMATLEAHQHFVVSGDAYGCVRLWDATRLDCANEFQGHSAAVTSLVFAKHMRKGCLLLASGDAAGVVMVWALEKDGNLLESNELRAHGGAVNEASFIAKGRQLVTVSADATACVWNLAKGELTARLAGHAAPIVSMASLFVRSATALVTAGADGHWCMWDIDMRQPVLRGGERGVCTHARFTPRVSALEPSRPLLATCHWSEGAREASVHFWDVFDLSEGAASGAAPQHSFHNAAHGPVTGVDFSRDHSGNPLMALAAGDGSLVIYDLQAQSILSHLTEVHVDVDGNVVPLHGLLYSMDGRLLVTCGEDGSVKVWSVADMEVLLTFLGHSSSVTRMCKPGGSHGVLATASQCGELAFWDLRLAQELASSGQTHLTTS